MSAESLDCGLNQTDLLLLSVVSAERKQRKKQKMREKMKHRNTLIMRAMMEAGIRNLSKKKIPNEGHLISLYDWWDEKSHDKVQVEIIHDRRDHADPFIMVYYFPNSSGAAVSATYYYGPVFVNAKTGKVKENLSV